MQHDPDSRTYETFSEDELDFIKMNYLHQNDRWIGDRIHRSKGSIRNKRLLMGLVKYQSCYSPHHKEATLKKSDIELEIDALVNFIETTSSDIWREIANTRRKELLTILKKSL